MGWGIELRKTNLGCRPCCLKGKAISPPPEARGGGESHVVEEPSTPGNRMHENRETSTSTAAGQSGSGSGQTAKLSVNGGEESESAEVPMKEPNEGKPEEALEGRADAKENRDEPRTNLTQGKATVSPGLVAVRQRARERRAEKFTNLLHHVTIDLLYASYYALQRKSAAGVDGVTWKEYETGLESRLNDLHSRVHRGAYRAQPSRRIYLPKPDGRQRPIGIAALEDKIVQQAVVTILNEIYEVDFRGFSYGFRPGRHAHQALDALSVGIARRHVNWILDADIQGFFDMLNHEWLVRFLEHRVTDSRLLRLIQKWLKAGVSEDGAWSESMLGTPPLVEIWEQLYHHCLPTFTYITSSTGG